jgi:oligopeptidase B
VRVALARRAKVRHSADHLNGRWVIRTNEDAPNFRLVSAPDSAPDDRKRWRTLVPGRDTATLENFVLLKHGIALEERVDADLSCAHAGQGAVRARGAPPTGKHHRLGENRDPAAAYLRYTVTSMVQPTLTYDLHLASGKKLLRKTLDVPGYDASRYATDTPVGTRARRKVRCP